MKLKSFGKLGKNLEKRGVKSSKHSLPQQNDLDLYYVYLYLESIVINDPSLQLWCYFLNNTIVNLVKLIEVMKFSLQSYINRESVAEVHIIIAYIDTLTNIKQLNHRFFGGK